MTPPSEHAVTWDEVRPTPNPEAADPVRIAVVSQLDIPGLRGAGRQINVQTTKTALQVLADLGAEVDFVDVTADAEPELDRIREADGILVLGGGDVDATLYGFTDEVPNEGGKDRRSDDRELRIMRDAIERDTTMLSICRGSQLLNVARGGSLIPDIQPHTQHHGDTRAGEELFIHADITLDPDSHIGRALGGRERITIRTGNHQAVDRPGEGLRVIARALDGVAFGTQLDSATWITGVQWHPEEYLADEADCRAIFGAFLDEVRRRRDEAA